MPYFGVDRHHGAGSSCRGRRIRPGEKSVRLRAAGDLYSAVAHPPARLAGARSPDRRGLPAALRYGAGSRGLPGRHHGAHRLTVGVRPMEDGPVRRGLAALACRLCPPGRRPHPEHQPWPDYALAGRLGPVGGVGKRPFLWSPEPGAAHRRPPVRCPGGHADHQALVLHGADCMYGQWPWLHVPQRVPLFLHRRHAGWICLRLAIPSDDHHNRGAVWL
mmetsp:Transcript_3697/g.10167  ORF Transcript_3697/g.10167 Transcript_3697/m.10167 type:complete len:218 (-) Transcript_3697:672-1325(-)